MTVDQGFRDDEPQDLDEEFIFADWDEAGDPDMPGTHALDEDGCLILDTEEFLEGSTGEEAGARPRPVATDGFDRGADDDGFLGETVVERGNDMFSDLDEETEDAGLSDLFSGKPRAVADDGDDERTLEEIAASGRLEAMEEDSLFEAGELESETLIHPEGAEAFSEDGTSSWAGEDIELEDLGVEMVGTEAEEDEEQALGFGLHDAEDLQLIDDDGTMRQPVPSRAARSGPAAEEDASEEEFQDFDAEADVHPDWAPVRPEDEDDDAASSEPEDVDEVVALGDDYEEPDYSEYEEYYEDAEVAQAAEKRRSPLALVASIAAVLLISAFGAVFYLEPEWLSMDPQQQVIEVIQVDRPDIPVEVTPPTEGEGETPGEGQPVGPEETVPEQTTPEQGMPEQTDPEQTGPDLGPTEVAGGTGLDPVVETPDEIVEPVTESERLTAIKADEVESISLGDGESFMSPEVDTRVMEEHRKASVDLHNGLVMGSQALAQLHNDNIIVGRVKMLNADLVTLHMDRGEITLVRDGVRVLTPLAANEYTEWKQAVTSGYVRLRNSNRLKGMIIEARDDSIVLQVNANRVIIPKSAIEEIAAGDHQRVQFAQDETVDKDEWVRRLIERRMAEESAEQKASKTKVPIEAGPGK